MRTIEFVEPKELWSHFDLKSLYRLSWGGANLKGDAWEKTVREEFDPRLRRFQEAAERELILSPRVVYGYYPAAGQGDDVVIYDPADPSREIARMTFARQAGGEHLCLADYFREPQTGSRVTSSRSSRYRGPRSLGAHRCLASCRGLQRELFLAWVFVCNRPKR